MTKPASRVSHSHSPKKLQDVTTGERRRLARRVLVVGTMNGEDAPFGARREVDEFVRRVHGAETELLAKAIAAGYEPSDYRDPRPWAALTD